MNDDRTGTNLVKKRDIGSKGTDIIGLTHRMTTKLDDQRLVGIAAHERQRLDKHAGFLEQV